MAVTTTEEWCSVRREEDNVQGLMKGLLVISLKLLSASSDLLGAGIN